jgi:phosphohistidine phosphatase
MELYFFRHAIAEDGSAALPDFDRKLTPEGSERTRRAGQVLQQLGIAPTRLFTSPLVRARQTADLLSDALKIAPEVRAELAPGFDLAALSVLLSDLGDAERVLLVGHEPGFSHVVGVITGGTRIVMKKGGLARIAVTLRKPLSGELVWLIAPKVFDQLD